jgi:hypothetical protein
MGDPLFQAALSPSDPSNQPRTALITEQAERIDALEAKVERLQAVLAEKSEGGLSRCRVG